MTGAFATTSVLEKATMAITGLVLSIYVVFHLFGNLLFFSGPASLDAYALALRRFPLLLWGARTVLLVSFVLHIAVAVRLTLKKRAARPAGYARRAWVEAGPASRTMLWTGLVLLAFVLLHLAHLTLGYLPDFMPGEVYRNIVLGFRKTPLFTSYLIGMFALGLHMSHGLFSMTQSLGLTGRSRLPRIKRTAFWIAVALALGFSSIPIAVMAGLAGRTVVLP